MTECFFSIVIPSYNYGHLLAKAINSVLGQHFESCEVIVINDGSTDNTDAVMQEMLKENDSRLRYVKQENKGLSAVRNIGVSQSKGNYLLFLDADDTLLPYSLANIHQFLIQYPQVDVLICDYLAQMEDGREKVRSNQVFSGQPEKWFYYYILNKMAMANGATIIRRNVFDGIRYCEDLRQAEDVPVFGMMLAKFHCMVFLRPVLKNFKHEDSMRNQIKFTPQAAEKLTNLLFDSKVLPDSFMRYRDVFLANQFFQLSRSYEKVGQYALAMNYYHKSLAVRPMLMLNVGRHVKYIRCFFKWLFR